jgi:Lysine methyltransferase
MDIKSVCSQHGSENHNSVIAIVVVEIDTTTDSSCGSATRCCQYDGSNPTVHAVHHEKTINHNNDETTFHSDNESLMTRIKIRINESHITSAVVQSMQHDDPKSTKSVLSGPYNRNDTTSSFFLSGRLLIRIMNKELRSMGYLKRQWEVMDDWDQTDDIPRNECDVTKSSSFLEENTRQCNNNNNNRVMFTSEIYCPHKKTYISCQTIPITWNLLDWIGKRIRVRINSTSTIDHDCCHDNDNEMKNNNQPLSTNQNSSSSSDSGMKLICGRYYDWDNTGIDEDGTIYHIISLRDSLDHSYHLKFQEVYNQSNNHPDGNTGNNVWDGSILMTRYLEAMVRKTSNVLSCHHYENNSSSESLTCTTRCYVYRDDVNSDAYISFFHNVKNIHLIIELGSGCGVAGISSKALGASNILLTDLSSTLTVLQANIDRNVNVIQQKHQSQKQALMEHPQSVIQRNCTSLTIENDNDRVRQDDGDIKTSCLATPSSYSDEQNLSQTDASTSSPASMICCECDWTKPISDKVLQYLQYCLTTTACSSFSSSINNKSSINTSTTFNDADNDTNQNVLILIADCIWMEHLVRPLLDTLHQLMQTIWTIHETVTINILITYQRRGKGTDELFWQCLHQMFPLPDQIRILDDPTFLPSIGIDHKPDIFSIISCCGRIT